MPFGFVIGYNDLPLLRRCIAEACRLREIPAFTASVPWTKRSLDDRWAAKPFPPLYGPKNEVSGEVPETGPVQAF